MIIISVYAIVPAYWVMLIDALWNALNDRNKREGVEQLSVREMLEKMEVFRSSANLHDQSEGGNIFLVPHELTSFVSRHHILLHPCNN
jgi:hypothetical protein